MKELFEAALTFLMTPVIMLSGIGHGTYSAPLMNMKVEDKHDHLELSGQTGESGTVICRVTQKKRKHDLIVEIHFVLCGVPHPLAPRRLPAGIQLDSLNGYRIPISQETDRILFGKNQAVIWERNAEHKN